MIDRAEVQLWGSTIGVVSMLQGRDYAAFEYDPDFAQSRVFNIVARNHDDHVKNIAFLMDRKGRWSLSPAFDMTYSYNPAGAWTATHQMTVNGKRDGFVMEDFRLAGDRATMKRGRAKTIVEEVISVVARWPEFAKQADVPDHWTNQIKQTHRLKFED